MPGTILCERLWSNSSFKRESVSQSVGELQSSEQIVVRQIRVVFENLAFRCTGSKPTQYVQTVIRVPAMMGWPERTPGRTTTRADVKSSAIILIVVQLQVFLIGDPSRGPSHPVRAPCECVRGARSLSSFGVLCD